MDEGKTTFLDELNCSFFCPNFEISLDQNEPFESALSSMVSSPTASGAKNDENVVLGEIIGRLGSICNSGEISPQAYRINGISSANTSCYSTPLNSPPKSGFSMMENHQIRGNLHNPSSHFPPMPYIAPFSGDPGFTERAARFSCLRNMGLNEMGSGKLSRVSSSQSIQIPGSHLKGTQEINDGAGIPVSGRKPIKNRAHKNSELGDSGENSSVSEQILLTETGLIPPNGAPPKKRKSTQREKGKETLSSTITTDSNAKRIKSDDENGSKKPSTDNNSKASEPPKDYIHVRARRGQATDAHSLAERVRREKISERMKFLQDLVPGCSKVTGKAVMLDEIINYVQSLQKQVEFLSMKLTIINPRMDLNMEAVMSKDILQSRGSLAQDIYPPNGYTYQSEGPSHTNQCDRLSFIDQISSQVPSFWEDDLHSFVQMGFAPNQSHTKPFYGILPLSNQMKVEP